MPRIAFPILAVCGAFALAACSPEPPSRERGRSAAPDAPADSSRQPGRPSMITVTSSAFAADAEIPIRYTCQGQDISPPLAWSGVPEGTRSLALIVEDPDAPDPAAPKRVWAHWVMYDLPPDAAALEEGAGAGKPPHGARAGANDWANPGYGGPCPPIGRHRYFHRLFALDTVLGDRGVLTAVALRREMEGHVLATGELVGTYQKRAQ